MVINLAIKELKVKKIVAHCDSENVSSYRVMEKLGMKFVSKTQGRRNKSSDEEREDLKYVLEIE